MISEIDTKPTTQGEYDEWLKDQKRRHDIPAGKDTRFVPAFQKPKAMNHNMGDGKLQLKDSYAGGRLHSDVGWGQIRHSLHPGDMNLNTRPKGCNQFEKLTSLGRGN